jgi:hypothetical protein
VNGSTPAVSTDDRSRNIDIGFKALTVVVMKCLSSGLKNKPRKRTACSRQQAEQCKQKGPDFANQ